MTKTVTTVNLYGEDGITILVDRLGDIIGSTSEADEFGLWPVTRVIGHSLYPGYTVESAYQSILAEYNRRKAAR